MRLLSSAMSVDERRFDTDGDGGLVQHMVGVSGT